MSKSIHRVSTPRVVAQEYSESALEVDDFRKAKWGSHSGMVNRFRLARSIVEWSYVKTWIDVGCGTGRLFRHIEADGFRFKLLTGVDISKPLIDIAIRERYSSPFEFKKINFVEMDGVSGDFDLVTAVGVLQRCGSHLDLAVPALTRLAGIGGQIFLTTKNLDWRRFKKKELIPEEGHSWFEYGDLAAAFERSGARIITSGGFLPRENRQVKLSESHTFFVLARREAKE